MLSATADADNSSERELAPEPNSILLSMPCGAQASQEKRGARYPDNRGGIGCSRRPWAGYHRVPSQHKRLAPSNWMKWEVRQAEAAKRKSWRQSHSSELEL